MKIDVKAIRLALKSVDPAPAHDAVTPPANEEIYAPADHEAALDPDRPLVVGGRGAGKSFWSAALVDPQARAFLGKIYPRLKLSKTRVSLGFSGTDISSQGALSAEIFDQLIEDGRKAELIWRAVFLRSAEDLIEEELPQTWRKLVAWCSEDAERLQQALREADKKLIAKGEKLVVVFDALDRLASEWPDIRERTKALMRTTLALSNYRGIAPKIFMRTDQAEDQALVAFPDASKLLGSKVDLYWERKDLYGLLFNLLANNDGKRNFARLVSEKTGLLMPHGKPISLPDSLKHDEVKQEQLFVGIAGRYMGSDARRGRTYPWIHNHLADAHGRVSPRTFLMAMREAAINASRSMVDKVVDPRGLQIGLQAASEHRLQQLQEEFLWIPDALEPLADLRVPCEATSIFERWRAAKTVEIITEGAKVNGYLEPVEFDGPSRHLSIQLLEALKRIGVAERRSDNRINVPDIYRVAAKLLRKGGVPPKR